jgi:hypothetical protein
MKKRNTKKKYPISSPQTKKDLTVPLLNVGEVKRIAFYITDKSSPNGKQRKVIALGVHYIEAMKHIGISNLSLWLGKVVDKHCLVHGYQNSWIHIAEYCIVQALLNKIERVIPVENL